MKKEKTSVSNSTDRYTFQIKKYVERCEQEGIKPSEDFLNMFLEEKQKSASKFDDPESRINNLEYDLRTTDWLLEKVRNNKTYAQNLYAAMCNTDFIKNDVWPLLTEKKWHCSWRYAGGIIADMRQEGDYIDWYCSGIKGGVSIDDNGREVSPGVEGYVGEGYVTDEIRQDLLKLGWIVIADDNLPV